MMFASMHMHSTFSDSIYTPEELAELARREGYGGIVLSDHDTVRGTYFMQKAARKQGLLSMLGCEFSTIGLGTAFHLLGYDFNPEEKEMKALLHHCSQKSTARAKLLTQWGIESGALKGITWEEVEEAFPFNDYLCVDQVFMVMKKKGLIEVRDEAFNRVFTFKDTEREARIQQITGLEYPQVEEVIRIIKKAGGVPVVAHPYGQLDYMEPLIQMGILGIEVNHPGLSKEESASLHRIAEERNLYKTGGTDHSGVFGGLPWDAPKRGCDPNVCGIGQEDFMKIYRRALG